MALGGFGRDDAAGQRFMVLGSGLYWCSALLQTAQVAVEYETDAQLVGGLSASALSFACSLVMVVAMAVVAACAKAFARPRAQKALALGAAVMALSDIVLASPLVKASSASVVALIVVGSVGDTCCILFWGLNFVALGRHEAQRVTAESLTAALFLYLVCSLLLPGETALTYVAQIEVIASVIPFLAGCYRLDLVRREERSPNGRVLLPFYGSRAFFGACLGTSSFLCMGLSVGAAQRSAPFCLVALVLLVVVAWRQIRVGDNESLSFLRFSPVTACALILSPFLGTQSTGTDIYCCAPAVVWMSWIILHSVQLSAIKGETGLDDALLSFSEKLVLMGSSLLSLGVLSVLSRFWDPLASDVQVGVSLIIVIVFGVVLVSCYQLTSAIDAKETARIVDNALELSDKRFEPVVKRLAERYGLTARELDVLRLLARNATRPAICEKLCISDGTARTHMWHIYQKMGIHSRDELMDILDQEVRAQVAQ